jgi:S-layer protein
MTYTSAQLVAAYAAANDGVGPNATDTAQLISLASQTQSGQISDAVALSFVINSAQPTVQVAWQSYEFFTGLSPTKAGLDYLVSPAGGNTNNLNSAYYAQFNVENRYLNFAANLALGGDGAAAFASSFGGYTFAHFVDITYETIIGSSYATPAGINVANAKADIVNRLPNFIQIAQDRGLITSTTTAAQQDLAIKAEVVGYLLVEGVKADIGIYAAGANNFVKALIAGNAVHNTTLATYASMGGGTGSAALIDGHTSAMQGDYSASLVGVEASPDAHHTL